MNQGTRTARDRGAQKELGAPGLSQGSLQGKGSSNKSPELSRITAWAIGLGEERLHPSLHTCDYLALNVRRKCMTEWLQRVPGNNLRVLDVGGRIQPYRPLLNGRLRNYFAVDPRKTGLVDVVAVGEHLPFADATFDLALCTGMLCYAEDPRQVIEEIYRVLCPGGIFLLSVPAIFPYHAENDRWRFFPSGLRLLLSRFSDVEVSPEGNSFAGIFGYISMSLDLSFKNGVLRKLIDTVLIPLANLSGARLSRWDHGNTRFTTHYCGFARR